MGNLGSGGHPGGKRATNLGRFITHRAGLDDFEAAISLLSQDSCKVLIVPSKNDNAPTEEDLRAAVDHHHVVAHAGHVGAAGGGVAEDQRDRRDAGGREPGEVAEQLPARDEDLLLRRQVGAAGLDQEISRQPVLPGDLQRAEASSSASTGCWRRP